MKWNRNRLSQYTYVHTYIIYSQTRNIFYAGVTSDPKKRLHYHNTSSSGFTQSGRPWIIVWLTEKASRMDSEHLEKKIKNLSRKRKLQFMRKYQDDIQKPEMIRSMWNKEN